MRALVLVALALLAVGCRESAPRRLQRAHDAIYDKDPQRAMKEYRLAIDSLDNDSSPEAAVLRARALRGAADTYFLELREYSRAVEVYRELMQACPEAPETLEGRVHLADLLHDHFHDTRGAINELTQALARNPPEGAELNYKVAKLYFELGDYPQAELETQNVMKKYETSAYVDDSLFLLGQSLAMEGKKPEANRAFLDLTERFPDSELQPHALFEMAKLAAESGDIEKAIELYVQALKNHPDPKLVQANISRLRNRIARTTPARVGDHASAFDHVAAARVHAKTSVEAVGGTAEEAAHDTGD